jgi:hypothetical protein
MNLKNLLTATILMGGISLASAKAAVIDLTFEGLGNLEPVANYYNNGLGGNGSGPGPNDGITFSSNALALVSDQSGGTGNFDSNALPSGVTGMFFLTGSAAILDDAAGFQTGFSLFYSAINQPGSLSVFSGLDGTGTLLGTLALPVTTASPPGRFQPFVPVGVTFAGTAESISFAGVENQIVFDDVTFGSATPGAIPEPATLALLGTGLFAMARLRRRRLQG